MPFSSMKEALGMADGKKVEKKVKVIPACELTSCESTQQVAEKARKDGVGGCMWHRHFPWSIISEKCWAQAERLVLIGQMKKIGLLYPEAGEL